MRRFAWIPLLLSQAVAQSPADLFHKAPPDVEEALMARVKGFYQAHVDDKFRQAEAYVAEDSKDYFYNSQKPHFYSFRVKSIKWGDKFDTAQVTVEVERTLPIRGMATKPVKIPEIGKWKLENGKWCWWVPKTSTMTTPFGTTPALPPAGTGQPAPAPKGLSADPANAVLDLDQVKVDRQKVEIGSTPEKIVITNKLKGPVDLVLQAPKLDVLTMELDRQQLKSGETAVLTVTPAVGERSRQHTIQIAIFVKQTGREVPVQITY